MKRLTLLFLIFPALCQAQLPVETRLFSPAELKQDLDFLFEKLEAIHPSLYHYTPKAQMDEARVALEKQLQEPMTRLEFARKAIPVVSMLNDGHTSLSFPQEELSGFMKKGGTLFPLNVLIREGKFFVTSNFSADTTD